MNVVVLRGVLTSEPQRRALPSGSALVSWQLTSQTASGKLSVPVSWFDPTASVDRLGKGDEVVVLGHVRRRFYRSGSGTQAVTEVVGERASLATRTSGVRSLAARA